MKSSNSTIAVFSLFGAIAFVPTVMVANALSIYLLWGWFAVPLLGLNAIGLVGAFGLDLLVGSLVSREVPKKEDDDIASVMGKALLKPASFIAFGWIAHFFI